MVAGSAFQAISQTAQPAERAVRSGRARTSRRHNNLSTLVSDKTHGFRCVV